MLAYKLEKEESLPIELSEVEIISLSIMVAAVLCCWKNACLNWTSTNQFDVVLWDVL